MSWKSKKISKRPFLLVEVLLSLTLVSAFIPSILRDQMLYHREIKKLSFLNDLESAFKKHLFNLYYEIHDKKYLSEIAELGDETLSLPYLDLEVVGYKKYKTQLILERHDKNSRNYHVSARIEVLGLPYKIKSIQKEAQKFWIKKKSI